MAYLALYRKYRPDTFEKLVGQEHIVKTLVNQINSDKLGHAYLFTGTRGTGKTSAAKIFSKAINCLNPVNGSPCGECECCKALSDPSNIDVIEIDAASNNGVNEIRELREKVQYPPVSCKYKVYIVDEVHMLTGPAFNALLKTLEEPPKHVVFILATTEVHKIPATILSRCMRFDFRLISVDKIASLISSIYDELGKKYEKEAVFAIAKAGEGSIRDALSIADIALSYSKNKLTYNDVMEILGSSSDDLILKFVQDILNSNTGKVLETVDELSSLGKSMGVLIKNVTAVIRDLLVAKTCGNANDILGFPQTKFNDYKSIADTTNEQRLLRVLEIFADAESLLKYSNHPRVVFETAAVKSAKPDVDYNFDALTARIKTLEDKLSKLEREGVKVIEKEVYLEKETKDNADEQSTDNPSDNQLDVQEKRYNLEDISVEDLKGKLLSALRSIGSELLWNVIQDVELAIKGNTITLIINNELDYDLLEKPVNKERIESAFEEFKPFDLEIKLCENEKNLNELDSAVERVKSIFGDDIVILK